MKNYICGYCMKEIKFNEPKFKSIFYNNFYICSKCAEKEDLLYFSDKNSSYFPDFSDEIQLELNYNNGDRYDK